MTDRDELLATANAVRVAVGVLNRRVRDHIVAGLSPSATTILSRLDRGSESIADLARREDVTPQAVGATVAALEARGLLVRAPDPRDRRRSLLSPTDAGRALIRANRDETAHRLADALEHHYSSDDVEAIRVAAPLIERLAHLL